jgi:predicted phage terminase large subunit-like protein
MHDELFDTIQKAVTNLNPDRIVRAAPRGNAKSTIISFVTALWCAVFAKKHYILLISDTSSQADSFLMNIKAEIEENKLLAKDFGQLFGEVWNTSDIVLSNDTRIQALGAGKRVRGRRYKQYRPDLIICDDIENDENVQSEEQRAKMNAWFNKALSKAGAETTDIVVIGTIIHYDSLLAKLLKNPIYDSRIYRAVIQFSNSPLWNQWEGIITDMENPKRLISAEEFYLKNKREMIKGTEVLWKEKEDYYNLMVQKIAEGPASFSSEKQNEPLSDDERRFLREWIQYYDEKDLVGKKLYVAGVVDPSLGKKGGDYSAILTGAMDTNNIVYLLDADIQRRHPDIIISDVLDKHSRFNYKLFGVETVQFQEYFKDSLKSKISESGVYLPVQEIKSHSDKTLRIQSIQPDIKNGRVRFRRDQQQLIEQLVNFPSADHDDGPDALEMLLTILGKKSAVAEYYEHQAHEATQQNTNSILQQFGVQGLIK